MVFTAREDIISLLEAWSTAPTFAADGDLSGEPAIGTSNDDEPNALASVHGRIRAYEESLNNIEPVANSFEDMHYRTTMTIQFAAQDSETKIKALMRQMRECFNTNNKLVNKAYRHKLIYSWGGTVKEGQIDVVVQSVEVAVVV